MTTGELLATAGILLALVSLSFIPVAAQSYTVTDLGTLGGKTSYAYAINDSGQVAGAFPLAGSSFHAFLWSRGTGIQDLGVLAPGGYSFAYGINNAGEVVGFSAGPSVGGPARGFLWTSDAGMIDVGDLGGGSTSANAINNSEQVVGFSELPGGETAHAFVWTRSEGMQDLGTLGGQSSNATAINDKGQVVGYSLLADNLTTHAFLWSQAGGMLDLGTLGGAQSEAAAINVNGRVAGYSSTISNTILAFMCTAGRTIFAMGETQQAYPFGINASGQVVGQLQIATEAGFIWTRSRGFRNLNGMMSHDKGLIVAAYGINRAGQIAGYSDKNHALLLTPIK